MATANFQVGNIFYAYGGGGSVASELIIVIIWVRKCFCSTAFEPAFTSLKSILWSLLLLFFFVMWNMNSFRKKIIVQR